MSTASALAYGSVALAAACWGAAAAAMPAERRWRRAGGAAIVALFVGAIVWLLVFSAGAALTIARDAGYVPMGEIATAAGGCAAALAGAGMAVMARRRERP